MGTQTCNQCGTSDNVLSAQFTRYGHQIGPLCVNCWRSSKTCERCGKLDKYQHDGRKKGISTNQKTAEVLCTTCRIQVKEELQKCGNCGKDRTNFTMCNGTKMCVLCASSTRFKCEVCNEWHNLADNVWENKTKQLEYLDLFCSTAGGICKPCFDVKAASIEPNKVHQCCCCRAVTAVDYFLDKEGKKKYICNICSGDVRKCDDCGHIGVGNFYNFKRRGGGKVHYCSKCSVKYKPCHFCSHAEPIEEMKIVNTGARSYHKKYACSHCATKLVSCRRCDKLGKASNMSTIGGHKYCSNCAMFVRQCSECKQITEFFYSDYNLCRMCMAKRHKYGKVEQYNFKPRFCAHKVGNSDLLFGIENEVSIKTNCSIDEAIAEVHAVWPEDEVYTVHDGSVTYGFEIVCHPRNFESIKKTDWKKLFPTNAKVHSSCGMHIHMSRSSFTQFHLFKFINFIHDKPNFIRLVGQRQGTGYCYKNSDKISSAVIGKSTSTRYGKINLQNAHTVELRFFSNVVREEALLKNVEFLKALYDFTLVSSKKQCTLKRFKKFVLENHKTFPHLVKFLAFYGVIDAPKVPTKKENK